LVIKNHKRTENPLLGLGVFTAGIDWLALNLSDWFLCCPALGAVITVSIT
jgi:hypothetical protein